MNEPEEEVTVDAGGVTVRKSLNDDQFETLAVVFDVRAGREEASYVTLTDEVPDSVPIDDIGFHPEYGGEHWRAEDGQVVFGRTFEAGEQYTTVYGIRDFTGEREDLLAEPGVEIGAPVDHAGDTEPGEVTDVNDLVSEEDSQVVREVISGKRDTLPGLGGEEPAGAEPEPVEDETVPEEPAAEATPDGPSVAAEEAADAAEEEPADEWDAEPIEADEPAAVGEGGPADGPAGDDDDHETAEPMYDDTTIDDEAAATPEDAVAAGDEDEEPEPADAAGSPAEAEEATEAAAPADVQAAGDDEITVPVTGGIARVLAKELRAGNVSYEDRRLLREELVPDEGSTDARIARLQNQVADLAAYTDALEQFLDDEGGAEAVIGRVEERVDALAADVEAVEDVVGSLRDDVHDVAEDVEAVEDDVEAVGSDVDSVAADVERVDGTVEGVESDLEAVRSDLDRLESVDRRVGGVEDDVDAIHDELEDLAEFRERLTSVFGAGGGMGDEDDQRE